MIVSNEAKYPSREDFAKVIGIQERKKSHVVGNSCSKETLSETRMPDHIRYEIEYKVQGGTVPAYMLWPKTLTPRLNKKEKLQRVPAVVVCHTHGSNWLSGANEMVGLVGDKSEAIALDLVSRGYLVIAPDIKGFNQRMKPSDQDPEGRKGEVAFNNMVIEYNLRKENFLKSVILEIMGAVDVITQIPEVNRERIALVGFSFGGHIASKTAVFDERVYATVAFGSVANIKTKIKTRSKLDPTENVYGLLEVGDTQEMLRWISPRAFLISSSSNDRYAPDSYKVYEYLRPFWEAENATQKLGMFYTYKNGHVLTPQMKKDAFDWLDKQMFANQDKAKEESA